MPKNKNEDQTFGDWEDARRRAWMAKLDKQVKARASNSIDGEVLLDLWNASGLESKLRVKAKVIENQPNDDQSTLFALVLSNGLVSYFPATDDLESLASYVQYFWGSEVAATTLRIPKHISRLNGQSMELATVYPAVIKVKQ